MSIPCIMAAISISVGIFGDSGLGDLTYFHLRTSSPKIYPKARYKFGENLNKTLVEMEI